MKVRNTITIVMAYYENGGMLDRHLQEWSKYLNPYKKKLRAIIVDDGSPKDPAIGHMGVDVGFPVSLFRIKEDIPWNQNGARNLAMTHAHGWCLITDMDHLLGADQLAVLMQMKLKKGRFYTPLRKRAVDGQPYKRHPNTYIINQEMYWKIGGFDEAYAGFYGTDSTFRKRLNREGTRVELNNLTLTLFGREVIPDASTVAYGRKATKYHVSRNPILADRKAMCPHPIKPLNFMWEKLL